MFDSLRSAPCALALRASVLTLLLLAAVPGLASEWPRFRGPHGGGVAEGSRLPVELGPDTNVAWSAEVPFGRSSPIVAGGAVYLTAADEEQLWLLSFDAATGKERWRHGVERPRHTEVYPANDTASPTPVSDGRTVFAFFPDFGMVAVSSEGKELWRRPMGPFRSHYGLAASPVLAGDLVIQLVDQQGGSEVVALDQRSGEPRWQQARPRNAAWATPIVVQSGERELLVTSGSVWLDAYDARSGEPLWSWPGIGGDVVASPTWADGSLYLLSGGGYEMPSFTGVLADQDKDGDGALSQAEFDANEEYRGHFGYFDDDGDGSLTAAEWDRINGITAAEGWGLVAVDLADPAAAPEKHRWRETKSLGYIPTPIHYAGSVFAVRGGGIFTSFDPATGEVQKRGRLDGALGEYYPSLVAGDGKIYAASNDGTIAVIEAKPEWTLLGVADLDETIDATPAIADGRLYVRTASKLWAFASP